MQQDSIVSRVHLSSSSASTLHITQLYSPILQPPSSFVSTVHIVLLSRNENCELKNLEWLTTCCSLILRLGSDVVTRRMTSSLFYRGQYKYFGRQQKKFYLLPFKHSFVYYKKKKQRKAKRQDKVLLFARQSVKRVLLCIRRQW